MGIMPDPVRVILRAHNGANIEEHICKLIPIGWRDQSAAWQFGFSTFGYNMKWTTKEFQFVEGDADFIRKYIDLYGISAKIEVIVQHRQNNWTYADTFTTNVDLSAGYVNDRAFIQVQVFEQGMKQSISKNGKANFDIPFAVKQDGAWVDDPDVVSINVPEGMRLREQVKYNTSKLAFYGTGLPGAFVIPFPSVYLNVDTNISNIFTADIIFGNQTGVIGISGLVESTLLPFLTTVESADTYNINILLKGNLNISATNTDQYRLIRLGIFDITDINNIFEYVRIKEFMLSDFELSNNYYSGNISVDTQLNIEINNNRRKYAMLIITNDIYPSVSKTPNDIIFNINGNFNIDFKARSVTSPFDFKAYRAEKFAQKLFEKVAPGATFEIPFLQQMEVLGMQLFITSADAIRGIFPADAVIDSEGIEVTPETQGALIKTNFDEFLKNLSCLYDTGTQVSNAQNFYRIVKKSEVWNKNNELLHLGEVKEMQIIIEEIDYLKNQIEIGYEKQEYDYPIGRQEPANTLGFIDDLNILVQKWDLVSKYRADYTGIHLLHYAMVNSDKKDSKSDNDVFWILAFKIGDIVEVPSPVAGTFFVHAPAIGRTYQQGEVLFTIEMAGTGLQQILAPVTGTVIWSLPLSRPININDVVCRMETNTNISWKAMSGNRVSNIKGLEGGGYFNILLSPKVMLMNHAEYFASILDRHEKILRYTSSTETMSALEFDDTELGHVVEKADMIVEAEPFFKPMLFKFDCVVKKSLPQILGESPSGYFSFRYNNLELKGFPIKIEGSYTDSSQTVTCMAHPDTPDNIQEILHKRLPNKLYP